MTFGIGRGFAAVQILKKKKNENESLNRLEYFDKVLQTIWCWKDLAQGITKWHLSSVEALRVPNSEKGENGHIPWTEWNILINFCVSIDIDTI